MSKKLAGVLGVASAIVAPMLAFAQLESCADRGGAGTLEWIICKIADLLNILVPILIVIAVIYFVWGVIQFVIADDEEAKKKGRDRIMYGVLGFVAIVALWGLVQIVINTFRIDDGGSINPPLPRVDY